MASEQVRAVKPSSISTLAIVGTKWLSVGIIAQKVWQMIVVVILARLLTPEDFGLVAMATLTLNAIGGIKSLSLGSAFIQREDSIGDAANAFFFLNLFFGAITFTIVFFAAPAIATFFNSSRVCPLLRVLSIQIGFEAASAVQRLLTVRALNVKKQTAIMFGNSFVTGTVSIVLAFNGYDVWALVYGTVSGSLVSTFLWWATVPWRPAFSFRGRIARELLRFGVAVSLADIFTRALNTVDGLFIGKFLGVVSLGLYDFSNRITRMPIQNVTMLNQRITFPAFCRIRESLEQLREWYLKTLRYACFLMAPLTVGIVLLADYAVPVIFGPKWISAVPVSRVLGVLVWTAVMFNLTIPIYTSTGRVGMMIKLLAARFMITVPVLFFTCGISLLAVCLGQLGVMAVFAFISLYLTTTIVTGSMLAVLKAFRAPAIGSGVLGVVILAFRYVGASLFGEPGVLFLLAVVITAASGYFLTIYLYEPRILSELKKIVGVSLRPATGGRSKDSHVDKLLSPEH